MTALQSVLLGRLLSIDMFGVTRTATAYMIMLTMIGHFTLHNALASSVVKKHDSDDISNLIFNASILVLGISVLTTLFATFFILKSGYWDNPVKIPLAIVFICLPLVCLTTTYNACLDATGEYRTYAVILLLNGAIPLFLLVGASKLWSFDGWLAARLISALLLFSISFYVIRRHLINVKFDFTACQQLLTFSRVQIFSGILSLALLSADVILLERITHDMATVANYGVALLFTSACAFIPATLGRVYFKDVAPNDRQGHRKRKEYLVAITATAIAFTFGLYYLGPMLIGLFFGDEYSLGQSIIRVMALGVLFSFLWNALSVINVAGGKPKNSVRISAAGSGVGLAALFLLIPEYGGMGAAWAMNSAYASGVAMGLWLLFFRRPEVEAPR